MLNKEYGKLSLELGKQMVTNKKENDLKKKLTQIVKSKGDLNKQLTSKVKNDSKDKMAEMLKSKFKDKVNKEHVSIINEKVQKQIEEQEILEHMNQRLKQRVIELEDQDMVNQERIKEYENQELILYETR